MFTAPTIPANFVGFTAAMPAVVVVPMNQIQTQAQAGHGGLHS
jgi:hypothetical protein